MPEDILASLNHFTSFRFTQNYYNLPTPQRLQLHQEWLSAIRLSAECLWLYQVYPAISGVDLLAWSALSARETGQTSVFFTRFAQATNPFRQWLEPVGILWGYTRPSQYARGRSPQELDPFATERKPYLVMYPFIKTPEWYLMGREARQGMMNEHIRIGKQYPQITQLLLYSFGLQDQEFIVVYETEDLALFSGLVNELRDTEARRYTLRDTPLTTAVFHPAEETLKLWA